MISAFRVGMRQISNNGSKMIRAYTSGFIARKDDNIKVGNPAGKFAGPIVQGAFWNDD